MTPATATKTSSAEEARLLKTRELLPGRIQQIWAAPRIARAAGPGQFLHVLAPRTAGLLLPAVPIAGYDRIGGTFSLLLPTGHPGTPGLATARPDDRARFEGPLGRGFAIDARSRYLLVVADVDGLARVRAIVDEAVAGGRQVTVLLEAPTVASVYPSSLLPDEAEYVVATADGSLGHRGAATDLLPRYEAWADQCFAAGSSSLLAGLTTLALGRDARMGVARLRRRRERRPKPGGRDVRRRAWLQLALPHDAGCALGICAGCIVSGASGPLRACREGPAFAAEELRAEPAR